MAITKFNNEPLKKYLKNSNKSYSHFSKQIGVHLNTVQDWITKGRIPSLDNLKKIAAIIQCDWKDLIK